ncbi:uncharacterized protein LOC100839758 [Brachypodium distachyon]|uniref:Bifunctional inhibitor/plant lipid transfer protein/seed storage helical domain-containing protein n=1 Tax=Brachypodium distachyon TaxID=15368 RepID=A0A0Q3J7R6_BRADI|nr:uncharacterized protein LOC100839758 [Brachypodium distachyon]KQK13867.1 hypothetical protein BRADI_1g12990v3 [Brachypodium distachyon]|eukprot:XP_014753339.1 uncharacterized protein LOC100839758 [Brachypodium distachyon]
MQRQSMAARRGVEVAGLAFVAVTLCAAVCSAQTTAAAAQPVVTMPTCAPVPISLSPCIGYVFGVGSATLSSCCSQLQAFFKSQGPCLCAMSKLAPSPFGLVLGQAQAMIPNVCNLPNDPCGGDVAGASTSPDDATTPKANATSPLDQAAPAAAPVAIPAGPDSEAPPVPAEKSPAAVTAPGKTAPEGAGSSSGTQVTSKLPELMHAAGARSSRDTAASTTVLITLFLTCVSAMYV